MRFSALVLCAGATVPLAPLDAQALSFGGVRSVVTLGQPLSVAVPITFEEGEQLPSECVRAEVLHGDILWPANVVRARLVQGAAGAADGQRVVRITSSAVVEEPVVTLTVHAGCPTRFSRTYTLLADPPVALATTSQAGEADDPAATPRAPRPSSGTASTPAVRRPVSKAAPGTERPSYALRSRSVAVQPAQPSASAPTGGALASPAPPPSAAPAAERGRLQLDGGAVSYARGALEAAQEQASAAQASARAAQQAASAAEQRVALLETELRKLREDSRAQLEATLAIQAQLAQAQASTRWLPWLLALALASTAAALWLAWRLRQELRASRRGAWYQPDSRHASPETKVDAAEVDAETPLRDGGRASSAFASQASVAPPPDKSGTAKSPIKPLERNSDFGDAHRAVTVDEQIDLEQEADFFIALGHDDAAIDLLLAHLRSTGGSVPLPYLKLLDMYRRRGDRDDYELMRRRFNQRFNSIAPEWDHDPTAGRVLEDYPEHVARLQKVWPRPLDAMAELEAMAFGRKDDNQELFDLPAYQDVLFLYQMARNLHDESDAPRGEDVDVLLPIDGDGTPVPVVRAVLPGVAAHGGAAAVETATPEPSMAVDFDLSSGHGGLTPYRGDHVGELPKIDLDLPVAPTKR